MFETGRDHMQRRSQCSTGGSGSPEGQLAEAVGYGAVGTNVATDAQWSYWGGLRDCYKAKAGYSQTQIGNPEGADRPSKKYHVHCVQPPGPDRGV